VGQARRLAPTNWVGAMNRTATQKGIWHL